MSCEHVKTIEGYTMLNFEFASFSRFRDIKNHFVTGVTENAEADIDDSIKRKRIHVSLNDRVGKSWKLLDLTTSKFTTL